jgi:methionyl aminopeptidase
LLPALREAGRIAAAARGFGAARIVAGATVAGVCAAVEDEIERLGGGLAFPAQSSRNAVAAHYCPGPRDPTRYEEGDLAKLDLGVHVDGWVVDTALTVNVGGSSGNARLVAATDAALAAAVAAAGPGVAVSVLSAEIARVIADHGLRPVRNIGGHGVGRFVVHCPPAVPNVPEHSSAVLRPGSVIAIEPFATDGEGLVAETGRAEVFRVDPRHEIGDGLGAPELLAALRAFRGLPFARRQLRRFPEAEVEACLERLASTRILSRYAPLVEVSGRKVAQTEHTIAVLEDGVVVLT